MQIHTAFYKFVTIADPAAVAHQLRAQLPPLKGSVIVASEGINAVLAGDIEVIERAEQFLTGAVGLGSYFAGMPFKRSACTSNPFGRLRVHVKPELVQLGAPEITAHFGPSTHQSLGPEEWREVLADPRAIVLDNRNSFEYRLGHFQGAINPQVQNFRDFTAYVEQHAEQWKQDGKRVAMYCTGGIRCEKTSAWMQAKGLDVMQLDGGVLNYFAKMPDAHLQWEGECFVFDNRVALNTRLQETSTRAEDVYLDSDDAPQERWRLQRAQRLDQDG